MHDFSFLHSTVLILLAAVVVVAVFRRFHLSPVLGYFVAGAATGEHGWFHFVKSEDTEVFGELGVVFLLFSIGLELTFESASFWLWWLAIPDHLSCYLLLSISCGWHFY